MIDVKKLKELVTLMKKNDICELDIKDGDDHIKLKRPDPTANTVPMVPMVQSPPPVAAPATAPAIPATATAPAETPSAADAGLIEIKSPMVGSFYAAPAPDAKDFVQTGDKIGPDTVVCLIEAMKVFNEIKAETSGVIEKVLVENGAAVEFDQPLFLVRP